MKMTLLEMVQDILGALDGDEVNSINDTIESQSVARIVKETYNYLFPMIELPEHYNFFKLTASGDSSKPVLMTKPSTVHQIRWLKYNTPDNSGNSVWEDLQYLPWDEFVLRTLGLKESESNVSTLVHSINGVNYEFKFYTDRAPSFYSSNDDTTIFFDAFDSTVSSTLVSARTLGYGIIDQTFTLSDSFTPALDSQQFSLLYNEAKAQAFNELKQVTNEKAEYRSRKGFIQAQRTKQNIPSKLPGLYSAPDYGRR